MSSVSKLPRSSSLKSKLEIDLLIKDGHKIFGDFFTLFWEECDKFKFSVFVSGKSGNAVARNKIKRDFREAVRLNRFKLEKDFKIAILPKNVKTKPGFDQINAEVSRIFERLNSAGK